MNGPRKPVLENYVKQGKKRIPPFLAALGDKHAPFSWTRQIAPELSWYAALIQTHGMREAAALASGLCIAASQVARAKTVPCFARLSAFDELSQDEKQQLFSKLSEDQRQKFLDALCDHLLIWPEHPLSFLGRVVPSGPPDKRLIEVAAGMTGELYDRLSRASALCAALGTYCAVAQGKLHLPKGTLEGKSNYFDAITDYPETEGSLRAAGMFRAGAPMIFGPLEPEGRPAAHSGWVTYFWEKVADSSECQSRFEVRLEQEPDDPFGRLIIGSGNVARTDFQKRRFAQKADLAEPEAQTTIGALLARQTTLFLEFSRSPASWTPNSAPLPLRAMADVFLTVAWIIKDPKARSRAYIEHGLGAMKLELAHREAALESDPNQEDADEMRELLDQGKAWLETQRLEGFVEVNLGSWSGSSTRSMASEADCLDFYNYVYQPFSGCVHSTYAHTGRFNVAPCENPSHGPHGVPAIFEFEPDPYWLFLAAKYLEKTFVHFDDYFGFEMEAPEILSYVVNGINQLLVQSSEHSSP